MLLDILIAIMVVKFCVQYYLSHINDKRLATYTYPQLPENIRNLFTPSEFEKTVQYNLEKSKFNTWSTFFYTCIVIVVVIPPFPAYIYSLFGPLLWQQVLFLICVLLVESIWSAGASYIFQFYIEEKYGFNKSTKKLWLKDTVLSLIISLILMSLVFSVFIYFATNFEFWWLWSFLFFIGFMLFMFIIGPYVISPLFNKFTELKDDKLKDELMALAKNSNFNAKKILMMDGSKRSKHSNAYFTGFGKFRRIVLYDTLVEQLSVEELKAVLAHEIGHYKRGHIPKTIVMMSLVMFVGFFVLSLVLKSNWVYEGLGFDVSLTGKVAPLIFFFFMMGDSWTYFINPIFNRISRKFEYEADAFAKGIMGEGHHLIGALGKLTSENMSNPLPHPLYSGFYYSHPTFQERCLALQKP